MSHTLNGQKEKTASDPERRLDSRIETEEVLQCFSERSKSILQRAAIATADLIEPVRLAETPGGYVFQTAKGENVPADVDSQTTEQMMRLFNDLCLEVDKRVKRKEDSDEDGITTDPITVPTWFGFDAPLGYVYALSDLSWQLHPQRSNALIDPHLLTMGKTRYGEQSLKQETINGIKEVLDKTCDRDLDCTYRHWYPHVQSAGPIALPNVVINLLTTGLCLAGATLDGLLNFFNELHEILTVGYSAPTTSKGKMHNLCICCLLTLQTRTYVDATTETTYYEDPKEVLTAVTFIGIMDTEMARFGHVEEEVDYFSPVRNFYNEPKCYLADCFPWANYKVVKKNREGDTQWHVYKSVDPKKDRQCTGVKHAVGFSSY